MISAFRFVGIIGLLLITIGIVYRKRKYQDILYIAGGSLLFAYSIYLQDLIFIILELVFVLAAIYDFSKKEKKWYQFWK